MMALRWRSNPVHSGFGHAREKRREVAPFFPHQTGEQHLAFRPNAAAVIQDVFQGACVSRQIEKLP